jgi:hypothetical protein
MIRALLWCQGVDSGPKTSGATTSTADAISQSSLHRQEKVEELQVEIVLGSPGDPNCYHRCDLVATSWEGLEPPGAEWAERTLIETLKGPKTPGLWMSVLELWVMHSCCAVFFMASVTVLTANCFQKTSVLAFPRGRLQEKHVVVNGVY